MSLTWVSILHFYRLLTVGKLFIHPTFHFSHFKNDSDTANTDLTASEGGLNKIMYFA